MTRRRKRASAAGQHACLDGDHPANSEISSGLAGNFGSENLTVSATQVSSTGAAATDEGIQRVLRFGTSERPEPVGEDLGDRVVDAYATSGGLGR